ALPRIVIRRIHATPLLLLPNPRPVRNRTVPLGLLSSPLRRPILSPVELPPHPVRYAPGAFMLQSTHVRGVLPNRGLLIDQRPPIPHRQSPCGSHSTARENCPSQCNGTSPISP